MSYEDDNHLGAQVLPVANLPSDFSGDVEDGAQYLFTVRREASTIPNHKRVDNPYEVVCNTSTEKGKQRDTSDIQEPSREWRISFTANFKNLRKQLNSVNVPPLSELPEGYMPFPGKKDKGGWLNYINELNREPKLSIMKSLTMISALTLMTFLLENAKEGGILADRQTRWLIYLIASREEDYSGELVSELRVIARSVAGIIQDNDKESDKKNLWMVLTAIVGGFNQYDLYTDFTNNDW
ncbi:hypothetical protein E3Q16_03437 [Wallemia mellicola]|uniref:Uncharacterized protein n=1 Tax=Wallemia mellicola TaxID=1708541 RepID=A0AB38MJY9_9BASI|nr:hypothetical protein E3Q24_01282 [Wallemia mellicola]TIB87734.1 hypothetical protein E3Q21_01242 [Wallemia mellicola]TIB90572.1 hypothetical protein E3Q20_01229 [Wallemia mellicola]TIC02591.1 hypothetical protein E3Q16_03437 [Wallemia mellicola]TIC21616.1 hypothetical protein E3Q12_03315 [Wallemia mellicola]